jgi:tetratricopeptide (TPR) repeat protein
MRSCTALLVAILALAPAGAGAQGGQSDEALAKQYYKLGEELYNRADYEGALKQFQQSHKFSKKPALLYNMARCHESMGQLTEAIKHYEAFLESSPQAPNAPVIRARIANLQKRLETKPASQPASQPAATQPTVEQPPVTVKKKKREELPPPPPPERSRTKRTVGWVLVGAGGAFLVTGLVLGIRAAGLQSELEDASAQHDDPTTQTPNFYSDHTDKEDMGQALSKAGIATLAVGGAAVATGALLLFLDYRYRAGRRERRAWIAPTLTAGGAQVSGTWHF